jgi:hypothetical protein
MLFRVDADVRYPDYSLFPEENDNTNNYIELSEKEYKDYMRVIKEYATWQEKIEKNMR